MLHSLFIMPTPARAQTRSTLERFRAVKTNLKPCHLLSLSMLLLASGCAYDYASGQAPNYPSDYDAGLGGGEYVQPGDVFGGQDVASIDVFLQPLAQYGRWVNSKYGRAFQPQAGQDYRPYVNGHWGEDRLWISEDSWGWATDHYGRWGFDDDFGWVWVPGTRWAPSWVAWREDDGQDVVGWAPIPPGVNYSIGVGFGSGFYYDDFNSWYAPSWVWVPRTNIYQRGFGGRVLPWNYGRNYWRGSQWNYNSGWNGRPGYNRPGGWAPRDRDQYRGNDQYGRPGYRQPDRRPDGQRPDGDRFDRQRPDGQRPDGQRPGYRQPDNRQPGDTGGYYDRRNNQPGQRPNGDRFGNQPGNTGIVPPYQQGRNNAPATDNSTGNGNGNVNGNGRGDRGYFDRRNRDGGAGNRDLPTVYRGVNPAGQPAATPQQPLAQPPRQRGYFQAPQNGNTPPPNNGGRRGGDGGRLGGDGGRLGGDGGYNGGGNTGGNRGYGGTQAASPPQTYQRPAQSYVAPPPPPPQAQPSPPPQPRRDDSGNRRNDSGDRPRTQPN